MFMSKCSKGGGAGGYIGNGGTEQGGAGGNGTRENQNYSLSSYPPGGNISRYSKVGGAGGGVGIFGEGVSGINRDSQYAPLDGFAGSGGNTSDIETTPETKLYGGGGRSACSSFSSGTVTSTAGGDGAIRILMFK
jgi:hypothetical protein